MTETACDDLHSGKLNRPLRIAIVGGGIGGLALALGLANQMKQGANIEFQIYEAASQFKEIGAGVGVGPNAYRALALLDLEKEYKDLVKNTHAASDSGLYFVWRWGEKHKIAEYDGDDVICTTPCTHEGGHTTVHRAHFLDLMINKLPTGVANFNKRLASYQQVEEEYPIKLDFEDGSSYSADCIIAADGIKSVVRSMLLKDDLPPEKLRPRFTGTTVYRGLIPIAEATAKLGGKAKQSTMYFGKDKHILTFPIQGGEVMNVVVFDSDRTEPAPIWSESEWIVTGSGSWEGWDDWTGECQSILKSLGKAAKWALHELHDLPTHAKGRVCLMGDSAAATLPHQGQGAAMAIESGYVLSRLLASSDIDHTNVNVALQAFGELRRDRVTGVKRTSNELGRIMEFADDEIRGEKAGLTKNLQERYEWIWGWDGAAEVHRGLALIQAKLSL